MGEENRNLPSAPGEAPWVRKTAVAINVMLALHLAYVGFRSGSWIAETDVYAGIVLGAANGIFATCAAMAAISHGRRWRPRWVIQLSIGMVPIIVVVYRHIFPLFGQIPGTP